MHQKQIEKDLKRAIEELGFKNVDPLLYISENVLFGDYTSNIALQLSKLDVDKKYQSPREIANALSEQFGHPNYLERIDIAGPGFINFFLKDSSLLKTLEEDSDKKEQKAKNSEEEFAERVLVEYASPNIYKPLHIGHLRNIITGETISRILQYAGKEVFRVTYVSDIGPLVAKTIWGIRQVPEKFFEVDKTGSLIEKALFLGDCYIAGNSAFEGDEKAKAEITEINVKLYQSDPDLVTLWQKTKSWSEGYLLSIYGRLGSEFDAHLWESEMGQRGIEIVNENVNSVFFEDQGAIIFPGEKFGLHNRVFITSKGTPTYEAKELAVTEREQELFPYDRAIHVVSNEQTEYFKVVTKAIELITPHISGKKIHQPYGFVGLSTGKMSSRLGNVILAENLIDQVKEKIKQTYPNEIPDTSLEKIAIAAVKFAYLKYSLNSDISFDIEQSVSLHGDSGPYILYTYARINSIIVKAKDLSPGKKLQNPELEFEEREVLRHLDYFESVTERAAEDFSPNDLANYLLTLAKSFNQFYEKHPILGSKKQDLRLKLAIAVAEKLKLGAYLLGFEVLEKM